MCDVNCDQEKASLKPPFNVGSLPLGKDVRTLPCETGAIPAC